MDSKGNIGTKEDFAKQYGMELKSHGQTADAKALEAKLAALVEVPAEKLEELKAATRQQRRAWYRQQDKLRKQLAKKLEAANRKA